MAEAVRVTVRVRPGASRTAVGGSHGGALVVAVNARPVDGKATAAVVEAVAEAFGVRRGDVDLVRGDASRTKILAVHGDPGTIRARLADLLAGR